MLLRIAEVMFDLGFALAVVDLIALLLAVFVHRVRQAMTMALTLSIQYWGLAFWVWCIAIAHHYWGWHPVILGLVLGVIGIIPVTGIGFVARHYWPEFGMFLYQFMLIVIGKAISYRMANRAV
jgi:hypothetical protein